MQHIEIIKSFDTVEFFGLEYLLRGSFPFEYMCKAVDAKN
jgi:hypothetical protein